MTTMKRLLLVSILALLSASVFGQRNDGYYISGNFATDGKTEYFTWEDSTKAKDQIFIINCDNKLYYSKPTTSDGVVVEHTFKAGYIVFVNHADTVHKYNAFRDHLTAAEIQKLKTKREKIVIHAYLNCKTGRPYELVFEISNDSELRYVEPKRLALIEEQLIKSMKYEFGSDRTSQLSFLKQEIVLKFEYF